MELLTPPGLTGRITLANDPLRGHLLRVDGQRVAPAGGKYTLPGSDGRDVVATMKGRWHSRFPTLVYEGQEHRLGPLTPSWLVILVALPLLFLFGGGVLPVLLGVVGFVFNLWVLRSASSEARKCVLILGLFVASVLVIVLWAFIVDFVLSAVR